MLDKLLKTLFVWIAATFAAVLYLRRNEGAPRRPEIRGVPHEVDADALSASERETLLRELDSQL